MQELFKRYVSTMQVLCNRYASTMQVLCKILQGFRLNESQGQGQKTKSLEAREQTIALKKKHFIRMDCQNLRVVIHFSPMFYNLQGY